MNLSDFDVYRKEKKGINKIKTIVKKNKPSRKEVMEIDHLFPKFSNDVERLFVYSIKNQRLRLSSLKNCYTRINDVELFMEKIVPVFEKKSSIYTKKSSLTEVIKQYNDKKIIFGSFIDGKMIPDSIYKGLSFEQRIGTFQYLSKNWDDYDAMPISQQNVKSALQFLRKTERFRELVSFTSPLPDGYIAIHLTDNIYRMEFKVLDSKRGTYNIFEYVNGKKKLYMPDQNYIISDLGQILTGYLKISNKKSDK